MARDARIEARLQRWAQWVTVGDGSGYPTMSVLHQNWTPPSGGETPTIKVGTWSDARQTHAMVRQLSLRLANTLVAHYCLKLPAAEAARRLECEERTYFDRIERAHRLLIQLLDHHSVIATCSD